MRVVLFFNNKRNCLIIKLLENTYLKIITILSNELKLCHRDIDMKDNVGQHLRKLYTVSFYDASMSTEMIK